MRRLTTPRSLPKRALRLAALLLALSLGGSAAAQSTAEAASGGPEALIGVGVGAGFPGYQSGSLELSTQAGSFGFAVRAAYGSVGFAGSVQARGYLPLPLGIPNFIGVGADLYAGELAPHLVFGVHLPINEVWRIDLEGGGAYPFTATERSWVPYLRVGVSLTFLAQANATGSARSATAGVAGGTAGGAAGSATAAPSCGDEPDSSLLAAAVAAEVATLERRYTAIYGSLYRDLSYSYSIRSVALQENAATVALEYSGSVVQRLNAEVLQAAGVAEVDFRWRNCRWSRTDLRY